METCFCSLVAIFIYFVNFFLWLVGQRRTVTIWMRLGVPWSLNSIACGSLICWSRAPAISLRPCSTPETLRHLQTDTQGVYSNAVESVFEKECKISDSYYLAKSNKCKTKKYKIFIDASNISIIMQTSMYKKVWQRS